MSYRSGSYQSQPEGYSTFIPKPISSDLALDLDMQVSGTLSNANSWFNCSDCLASNLPFSAITKHLLLLREGYYSSKPIVNRSSYIKLIEYEMGLESSDYIKDIFDVITYVRALMHGMKRLYSGESISSMLISDIHRILMGENRSKFQPGYFRKSQNWIGPPELSIHEALYIPPPANKLNELMSRLINFINGEDGMHVLVKAALIHYQFEAIHPLDKGNGRLGRLLLTLFLYKVGFKYQPILPINYYFNVTCNDYYDTLLKAETKGDYEGWIQYFLENIIASSDLQIQTLKNIVDLREKLFEDVYSSSTNSINNVKLVDVLFDRPIITTQNVIEELGVTKDTASRLIKQFVDSEVIKEMTGNKRYQRFIFSGLIDIICLN